MDLIRKDLEDLRVAISHNKFLLRRDQAEETTTSENNSSDHGAGGTEVASLGGLSTEMAIALVADNTPLESAMTQPSDPLQSRKKPLSWRSMKVMKANLQLGPSPQGGRDTHWW